MKKSVLFFFLSFCTCCVMKGQVMHSSHAMEYSIGGERFSQWTAKSEDFSFLGRVNQLSPEVFRWRPILTAKYKKFNDAGNYFGLGLQIGYSSWGEEVLVSNFNDFIITNLPVLSLVFETNEETKLGISYQYSFLMNKKQNNNFQFFVGGGIDLYSTFANKSQENFFFGPLLRRNIVGARISVMPELMYLVPNNRVTISLRVILPITDLQRIDEELRQSSFNSFSQFRVVNNEFRFVPIGRSRFEIGFGYFLKSK